MFTRAGGADTEDVNDYALRLDEGDNYGFALYESPDPLRAGARIDYDERRWEVVEANTLRLDTPDGIESVTQLVCRPAA